ncbi:hypothetical protein H7J77_06920 [Mycolicibacillus parakoreensis]|uniref:Uncharacterized protein n=1 Tax=Mycolicibacillus parakoreensis TaxID=1069221 RepID=A0ABY3U6M4_9MYCO|nr:hypothetical protein [Mycolicibacillus parakoreensis]MCV7315270.1 hypothetical protein [Mycolicibacillus parakoreensis]ULN53401.1 hypothetical protein MIU77_03365 [Mycolicibacillus parakoreensis]
MSDTAGPDAGNPGEADADDWDAWVESTEATRPVRRQPRACGTEPHL